jgi:hypothetical protein
MKGKKPPEERAGRREACVSRPERNDFRFTPEAMRLLDEELRVGEDRHTCAGLSLDVASAAR